MAKRTGAERIADERKRQVKVELYTKRHDDNHDLGEMALAAACYAGVCGGERILVKKFRGDGPDYYRDPWPWNKASDKRPLALDGGPCTGLDGAPRLRLLEKAGALIAAEIDRLLRLEGSDA